MKKSIFWNPEACFRVFGRQAVRFQNKTCDLLIYITRQQNLYVKRKAKERGISESEVIRQALECELQRIEYSKKKSK